MQKRLWVKDTDFQWTECDWNFEMNEFLGGEVGELRCDGDSGINKSRFMDANEYKGAPFCNR